MNRYVVVRAILCWVVTNLGLLGSVHALEEGTDGIEADATLTAEADPPQTETKERLELRAKHGSLRLGLLLQTGMDVFPNQLSDRRFGFSFQRARLGLSGHVIHEDLTYLITGGATSGVLLLDSLGYPGTEILPETGEAEVPFLLDARVNWDIRKLGIRFSVGRFIPKWGLSMPEKITRLSAISYPLYVLGGIGSLGTFRSIGVEAEVKVLDHVDIGGGVFNGGRNTWRDNNNRKDILLFISTDPVPGLRVRASAMFAFPEVPVTDPEAPDPSETSAPSTRTETHIRSILEGRYQEHGFDAMAGVAHAAVIREIEGAQADYASFGFMAHLGYYFIGDWFQFMGRLEMWEPNNDANRDKQTRITAGPQLHIYNRNLQININYIQDFFASPGAMCLTHLGAPNCPASALPTEARKQAAAILLQLTLAL